MDLTIWLVYSAVVLLNVFIPGPAVFLAVSNSMAYGVRNVLVSSAGNITGLLLLSSAAFFGLGAVLNTSAGLFTALKVIGAGYLIYLGIRQWRAPSRLVAPVVDPAHSKLRHTRVFVQGFLVAITNPKPILFFAALFPQFIRPEQPLLSQFSILTLTFMVLSYSGLMCYAVLARYAKRLLSNEFYIGRFNRMTGAIFVMLGVGILQLKRIQ